MADRLHNNSAVRCPTMCGLEFGEEFEHVIMLPADDPVTAADLDRIRWCQTDGDGIGVNIKTGEQDGVVGGSLAGVPDDGGGGPAGGFRGGIGGRRFL